MKDIEPVSTVEAAIDELAAAGRCLVEMQASEGAAGNLSVYLAPGTVVPSIFADVEVIEMPFAVPELAASLFIVTGSGTRMRDIDKQPGGCLGVLEVLPGGERAKIHCAKERRFARITSEFGSHLSVHREQVKVNRLGFHAVVHAQPRKLTYLSHLPEYQSFAELNRRLLRWQPEGILNFPEGIAVIDFFAPSSSELVLATERSLRDHRLVIWAKHGVMARCPSSVLGAVDLIEYAETAASYECLDRALGGQAPGLSADDLRAVARAYGVVARVL